MMCDDTCPNACGRCHRCAEEITRLRADITRYVSRDTERLAEVEKLREALKPFAQIPPAYIGAIEQREAVYYWSEIGSPTRSHFTRDDLRRARAVLTGTEAPQEENVTEPLGEAHFSDPKPLG